MLGTKSMPHPRDARITDASAAVARAYRDHGAEVFRVALRLGRGNRAWAEDITHEVFLALYDGWASVRDPEHLTGWLYRATVRRSLNRLRRERLWERPWVRGLVAAWRSPGPDPERISLGQERLDQVLARVAALPDKQRAVFCMHHFDHRTGREIAELLGHSEGYVSKLLSRAEAAVALASPEATP